MNPQPAPYPYGYQNYQAAPASAPPCQPPPQPVTGSAWKTGVAFALVLVPVVLFTAWGVLMEVRINKLTESQFSREQADQLRGQIQNLEGRLADVGSKLNAAASGLERAANALENLIPAEEPKALLPKAADPKVGEPKRESPPK